MGSKFKMMMVWFFLLTATWLLMLPQTVSADGPIYVDADAAGPTYDGLSWTTAYTTVQDALTIAGSGDEIWVGEGVYYPDEGAGQTDNDRYATFSPIGVALYGGFDPQSGIDAWDERDWETYPTVLSGDIAQDDATDPNGVVTTTAHISGTNAYHVLWLDGTTNEPISTTTTIDGFTITAGQANGTAAPHYFGGGLTCDGSGSGNACSPTLAHLVFSGNYARSSASVYDGVGGGMYNNAGSGGTSSPTLTDVTFVSNLGSSGGGMYNYGSDNGVSNPTLTNVTFSENQASNGYGGGMVNAGISGTSSPVLTDVTFIDNYAASDGGGMVNGGYDGGTSRPVLTRVTFIGNQAASSSGGMANVGVTGGTSSPILTDVVFRGNWTNGNGGGMYSYLYSSGTSNPVLTNVIFSGNRAGAYGGGMANNGASGTSSPVLTNVTFSGNWASNQGGGMFNNGNSGTCSPLLSNVILWGNSGSQVYNSYASPTLNYSLVQGGCPTGAICDAHLLTSNPNFVAPIAATSAPTTSGDYRLLGNSPAIDAGNTLSVTVPTDLAGNPRLHDGDGDSTATVDLGAYEARAILYVDATATTGADDGTSWADAFLHLQDALDETNADGTYNFEIWVAEGVYYPDEDSDGGHEGDVISETFTLSYDNVRLYGGFAPLSGADEWAERDWQVYPTVLSGDIGQDDTTDVNNVVTTTAHISGSNAHHVLWLDGVTNEPISTTTIIDGFTITAGQANGTEDPHYWGGGLVCDGSGSGNACSPTLAHLAFHGNYAQSSASAYNGGGGGMYSNAEYDGISSPLLTDVTFDSNYAAYGGGMFNNGAYNGVSNPTLIDVTFNDNHATNYGGGMLNNNYQGNNSPTLTNITFSNNQAAIGGGMANYTQEGTSISTLTNVIFSGNQATIVGGGMYNYGNNGASSPVLTNVTFSGNQAGNFGGGMYNEGYQGGDGSPTLTNVTFSGNYATERGGGMYNYTYQGTSSPLLTNVTFSGNQSDSDGGGMYNYGNQGISSPLLTNVIMWGNGAPSGTVMVNNVATPTIAYSLIEGGVGGPGIYNDGASVIDGGGNVAADPQFVAPVTATATPTTTGDYRLLGSSPAIDAGNNAAITITTDLDGTPRFFNHPRSDSGSGVPPIVDMGAYETPNTPPQANAGAPYSGDEGISIALDGSASGDIDTDDVLWFEWDCTADDVYDTSSYTATDSVCTYPQDGDYTLRLRVTDSLSATAIATATVTVHNVALLAADDAYTMTEDSVLTVPAPGLLLNDSDVPSDTLNAMLVPPLPSSGTLDFQLDGAFIYTPTSNFYGVVTFTYKASDTVSDSLAATVVITVASVNDAPVADDDVFIVREDGLSEMLAVLDGDTDVEGDILTVLEVSDPANGTLTNDFYVLYTPDADFFGTDTFTYVVSDGVLTDTATVTITVTGEPDAPVADDDTFTVVEDSLGNVLDVLDGDTDVDGDILTAFDFSDPANGTVVTATTHVTYTPDANFFGTDTFIYVASDGFGFFATATVIVTVTPVNDPPVADDDTFTVAEDSVDNVLDVLTGDTDIEGDILTVLEVSNPANGTVVNATTHILYTPDADFFGTDSFTYVVSDGTLTDTAIVTVIVSAVNDAPVADAGGDQRADTYTTVTLDGSASFDLEGDTPLSYHWTQTGGVPVVALSDVTTQAHTFTALSSLTVLTFTLTVTDSLGLPDPTPDEVVITITDGDADGDGISDTSEGTGDPDADGLPNYLDADSDNDGVPDSVEGTGDADDDGLPNYLDTDSDDDGIPDIVETGNGALDGNGEGVIDDATDSDGDGLPDGADPDSGGTSAIMIDSDGDGIPNYLDTDSDADGIPDVVEGVADRDGDGVPDYVDANANPTIGSIADQVTPVSVPLSATFTISDADDALAGLWLYAESSNVSVVNGGLAGTVMLGSGLSIDCVAAACTLWITPTVGATGLTTITVTVDDSQDTASTRFVLMVGMNDPPAFTSLPVLTGTVGTVYAYAVTASDPNVGDVLTLTAPMLPAWLSLTDNGDGSATLSGTPTLTGTYSVVLRVSDGVTSVTQPFFVTVSPASNNIFLPLVTRKAIP